MSIKLLVLPAILSCLFFSNSSFSESALQGYNSERSETTIYFGGWSSHSSNKELNEDYFLSTGKKFKYNENHQGLGIQYAIPYKETDNFLVFDGWYMKDSYNQPAYQLSLAYKHRFRFENIIESVDLGLGISLANRSFLDIDMDSYAFYKRVDGEKQQVVYENNNIYGLKRGLLVAPLPFATFNITKKFKLDFTLLAFPVDFYKSSTHDSYEEYDNQSKTSSYEVVGFVRAGYTF